MPTNELTKIDGVLDKGIESVVNLLRENGIDTFASCEGGPDHDFDSPTVRIQPGNVFGMYAELTRIASILNDAGYAGYYLKTVFSYQNSANAWMPEEQNFIELEFWGTHDMLIPKSKERADDMV